MIPAVIESPFAGCTPINRAYLNAAIRDSLGRGETPYASHQMLTTALDDTDAAQREQGLAAGRAMTRALLSIPGARHVFYIDLGFSRGMGHAAYVAGRVRLERRISPVELGGVLCEAYKRDEYIRQIIDARGGFRGCDLARVASEIASQWCEIAPPDHQRRSARGAA